MKTITITDEQEQALAMLGLDFGIEYTYPLVKKWQPNGEVVKFTSLTGGTVVVSGSDTHPIGYTSENFTNHIDKNWDDVPYNRELDLYHGQPVECFDRMSTHIKSYRFYDAINRVAFSYNGMLDGACFTTYKAIPTDKIPEWMHDAYKTLEGI